MRSATKVRLSFAAAFLALSVLGWVRVLAYDEGIYFPIAVVGWFFFILALSRALFGLCPKENGHA